MLEKIDPGAPENFSWNAHKNKIYQYKNHTEINMQLTRFTEAKQSLKENYPLYIIPQIIDGAQPPHQPKLSISDFTLPSIEGLSKQNSFNKQAKS